MSGVSKAEILALVDSNTKVAVVLEKIVTRMEAMALNQEKILEKMNNGVCGDIKTIKETTTKSKEDVFWLKLIIGSATLIFAIAALFLKFAGK